jgi:acyl dehydratase
MTVFFEDLAVGDTFELGTYDVSESEIREFAEQYDPQWFHTDPERAREESMYGGLIASGWHTASMTMRLLVDGFFSNAASLGAKGVDDLRWRRPVRPGDTLSVTVEVVGRDAETTERGLVRLSILTTNDTEETVCSMTADTMFARRDAGNADEPDDAGD